ncbi:hypothetical protein [Cyclobacterium xiamenense]|uniref:hypothetical protein n=1 Tax=Cyclobacterium xiamenense TaxID=1297121 RepID=UPI0035CFC90D
MATAMISLHAIYCFNVPNVRSLFANFDDLFFITFARFRNGCLRNLRWYRFKKAGEYLHTAATLKRQAPSGELVLLEASGKTF